MVVHWKTKSALDDTLDVFPCHGVGGMVGMLMTGVFARDVGLVTGATRTFLVHCRGLLFSTVFAVFRSEGVSKTDEFVTPLRVSPRPADIGLQPSTPRQGEDQ